MTLVWILFFLTAFCFAQFLVLTALTFISWFRLMASQKKFDSKTSLKL